MKTENLNRIGFCLLMLSSEKDPLAQAYIPLVRASGYDYAEIPFVKVSAASEREIRTYQEHFAQEGLRIAAFNNGMSPTFHLLGRNNVKNEWRAYIDRVMQLADYFGVSLITSCAPYLNSVDASFSWEAYGRDQYAEFLCQIDEACKKYHVKYAIEPICRQEESFITTLGEAVHVLQLAKCSGHVGICPDFFHMRTEQDDFASLPHLVERGMILHLHYADPVGRSAPACGRTEVYRKELSVLLHAGYQGNISVEARVRHPAEELPDAQNVIRSVLY